MFQCPVYGRAVFRGGTITQTILLVLEKIYTFEALWLYSIAKFAELTRESQKIKASAKIQNK